MHWTTILNYDYFVDFFSMNLCQREIFCFVANDFDSRQRAFVEGLDYASTCSVKITNWKSCNKHTFATTTTIQHHGLRRTKAGRTTLLLDHLLLWCSRMGDWLHSSRLYTGILRMVGWCWNLRGESIPVLQSIWNTVIRLTQKFPLSLFAL